MLMLDLLLIPAFIRTDSGIVVSGREALFAISRVGDLCVLRLPLYLSVRLLPQRLRHASAYPGGSVSDNKFPLLYSLLVSPLINKSTTYDQKFHFTIQLN